jgi:hypothetical protein
MCEVGCHLMTDADIVSAAMEQMGDKLDGEFE